MTHTNPSWEQTNYRIRSGDTVGLNTDSGWASGLNNSGGTPSITVDSTFRVRIELAENANQTVDEACPTQLEARLNTGSWQDVTTSSTIVRAVASGQFNEGDATTNLLSGSGRTFQAGSGCEDGLANIPTTPVANEHTEFEYAVRIVGTDVANSDTVQMRIKSTGTSITYTNTAQVTAYKVVSITVDLDTPNIWCGATADLTPSAIDITVGPTTAAAAAAGIIPTQVGDIGGGDKTIDCTGILATANATALVPTITIDLTSLIAAAAATAPVPTITIDLTSPLATALAQAIVPAVTVDDTETAVPAVAAAAGLVPTITVDDTETAVPAIAAAAGLVPAVTVDDTETAVPAIAAATATAPAVGTNVPAVPASAAATALVPTITVDLAAPLATATAAALVPTISISLDPPLAIAAAVALVPTIVHDETEVAPPAIALAAIAPVPTLVHSETEVAPPAIAVAAITPVPTITITLAPPLATATAAGIVPEVASDKNVDCTGVLATAAAAAIVPTVSVDDTEVAVPATALAAALVPTLTVDPAPPSAIALARMDPYPTVDSGSPTTTIDCTGILATAVASLTPSSIDIEIGAIAAVATAVVPKVFSPPYIPPAVASATGGLHEVAGLGGSVFSPQAARAVASMTPSALDTEIGPIAAVADATAVAPSFEPPDTQPLPPIASAFAVMTGDDVFPAMESWTGPTLTITISAPPAIASAVIDPVPALSGSIFPISPNPDPAIAVARGIVPVLFVQSSFPDAYLSTPPAVATSFIPTRKLGISAGSARYGRRYMRPRVRARR